MKFNEIEYIRPDIKSIENKFDTLLDRFDKADSVDVQNEVIKEINDLRMEFQTMSTLAHIRYSIETTNKKYEAEQEYFDVNIPAYEGLVTNYYFSIINSRFRKELEAKWGKQLFAYAETIIKTHKPEIVDDLKLENKLRTDYTKIIASAKIVHVISM